MFAVIQTGGKQYVVQKGDRLKIEKIEAEVGQLITLENVLLIAEGATVDIGSPMVAGAKVTAKIVDQAKEQKVTVIKHTSKKRTKKKQGHRQMMTTIEVTGITK